MGKTLIGADDTPLLILTIILQTNGLISLSLPSPHNSVAGKLKGLFLLFAGHVVTNMASLLKETNKDKHGERETAWTPGCSI